MLCGTNELYQFGNGTNSNIYAVTEAPQFENCKYVTTNGVSTIFIDNTDTLYRCGTWYDISSKMRYLSKPQRVMEEVKEAELTTQEYAIYIITKNGEVMKNVGFEDVKITNLINDLDSTFLFGQYIINNGKIYEIGTAKKATTANIKYNDLTGFEKITDKNYLYGNNINMLTFISNERIYVHAKPDITKIVEKSNYKLREIFQSVVFVNGNGNNLCVVNREGNVYENLSENSKINNVKKIISSNYQKFIITRDKHIYAKGDGAGRMWGDTQSRNEYVELTDENGKIFDNVQNVFTSSYGLSVIFQTEDGKLYFGGNTNYITLPRNKRRVKIT